MSYPRPPIVEAIIELRLGGDIRRDWLYSTLKAGLSERYPAEPMKQNRLHFAAKVGEDGISTSSEQKLQTMFLKSAGGNQLLGCAPNTLSVHVLPPYPGWENLLDQAMEAASVLSAAMPGIAADAAIVRYLDRISLPPGSFDLSQFFTILPPKPEGMPPIVNAFNFSTQAYNPADGTTALLTFACIPPDQSGQEERQPIIIDLLTQYVGEPLPLADPRLASKLDALHAKHSVIFESSITDLTRDLFR